ncbi:MAG: hypothetical protein D3905_14290, partial [Candidatus Electrothrix sp. AS4_5]|nr:hypothetical protein [Candidatus Electrothrix gigas]
MPAFRQCSATPWIKAANFKLSEEDLCPKKGVYVTQVLYNNKMYGSVTNIGCNPTFG